MLSGAPRPVRKKATAFAPGYRFEHHDLAELLARPDSAETADLRDRACQLVESSHIITTSRIIAAEMEAAERCADAFREGFHSGVDAGDAPTNVQAAWLNSDTFKGLADLCNLCQA